MEEALRTLIQFGKDQGWDEPEVSAAYHDLELALRQGRIKFIEP